VIRYRLLEWQCVISAFSARNAAGPRQRTAPRRTLVLQDGTQAICSVRSAVICAMHSARQRFRLSGPPRGRQRAIGTHVSGVSQGYARTRGHVESADWTPMLKLNRQFHFEMCGLSPFKFVLEQVDRLWTLAEPYTAAKLSTVDARRRTIAEHDELLGALSQRDRGRCLRILRLHRSGRAEGNSYELPVASEHVSIDYMSDRGDAVDHTT
jgi:hypothetical protein